MCKLFFRKTMFFLSQKIQHLISHNFSQDFGVSWITKSCIVGSASDKGRLPGKAGRFTTSPAMLLTGNTTCESQDLKQRHWKQTKTVPRINRLESILIDLYQRKKINSQIDEEMGSILRGVPWFQWWCPEQRPWTLHLLPTAGTLQLAGPRFRQHQQRQLRQLRRKKTRPYCTQQLFSHQDTEILPKPLRMPTTTCKAERWKDQNWSVESCNV